MAEPNAFFCVLEPSDGGLAPSLDAVKQHGGCDAIWLRPGARFSQAVQSIQDYAKLPPNSEFSYLSVFMQRYASWVRMREELHSRVVQLGVTYCFKVVASGPAKKRKREGADKKLPLHVTFDYAPSYSVQSAGFESFAAKGESQSLARQMVSSLAQICSTDGDRERDGLREAFRSQYHIAVQRGKEYWNLSSSAAGVMLLDGSTFCSSLPIRPGSDGYIQSGELSLDNEGGCLKELALLYWLSQVLEIKPKIQVDERLTLSNGTSSRKQVQVLEHLNASEPASNAVLKLSDSERELVMKVGHSPEASKLIEHLCLNPSTADQAVNEGKILQKLQGCSSVPPLAFLGRWDDKPVVLTELQGSPFEKAYPSGLTQSTAVECLCKELTRIVMELHERGVAHGDITPRNVGVYTRPEDHGGRKYYLYDFGFAVELQTGSGKAVAVNPLFSAAETIESHVVTLATELASVVYLCLYVAGVRLPWEELVHWGPRLACVPRRDFAKSLKDLELPNVTPALRQWMLFVLTQASNAAPEETYSNFTKIYSRRNIF